MQQENRLTVSASPHIKDKDNVNKIIWYVILALLPVWKLLPILFPEYITVWDLIRALSPITVCNFPALYPFGGAPMMTKSSIVQFLPSLTLS